MPDVPVNDLVPATDNVTADGTQYVLADGADGIGFYRVTDGSTIPAGKAYLVIRSDGEGVKDFVGFEDDATGISKVDATLNAADAIYNAAGQRLSKMQRGINIVGNKKVVIFLPFCPRLSSFVHYLVTFGIGTELVPLVSES